MNHENPFTLPKQPHIDLEGSELIHTDDTILPQEPICNRLRQKHHPDSGHRVSVVSGRLGKYFGKLAVKERNEIQTENSARQIAPDKKPSNN